MIYNAQPISDARGRDIVDLGDIATWVGSLGAVVASVFALVIATSLRGRERRQALANAHVDLTTGEVAAARDVIGTLLYGTPSQADKVQSISALFRLYWAVQRFANVQRVYMPRPDRRHEKRIEEFLTWNLTEIVLNIGMYRLRFGEELTVEDDDAWQDLVGYLSRSQPELLSRLESQAP